MNFPPHFDSTVLETLRLYEQMLIIRFIRTGIESTKIDCPKIIVHSPAGVAMSTLISK